MTSIYIGIAGILGALVRYGLSFEWNPGSPDTFPWGTLICNYSGCLLLSFLANAHFIKLHFQLRIAITTGFIGAFTTFSSFSFETFAMLHAGHSRLALLYMMVSLWGGLLCVWAGSRIAVLGALKGAAE
jgi:CrcB protein